MGSRIKFHQRKYKAVTQLHRQHGPLKRAAAVFLRRYVYNYTFLFSTVDWTSTRAEGFLSTDPCFLFVFLSIKQTTCLISVTDDTN